MTAFIPGTQTAFYSASAPAAFNGAVISGLDNNQAYRISYVVYVDGSPVAGDSDNLILRCAQIANGPAMLIGVALPISGAVVERNDIYGYPVAGIIDILTAANGTGHYHIDLQVTEVYPSANGFNY